jgi:hypothetical protein
MLCGVMSGPLPTTELVAFRPAEVKAGKIVVPVLLASGEWAAIAAVPSVMRQICGSVDAAFDAIAKTPSPAKRTLPR